MLQRGGHRDGHASKNGYRERKGLSRKVDDDEEQAQAEKQVSIRQGEVARTKQDLAGVGQPDWKSLRGEVKARRDRLIGVLPAALAMIE